MARPRLHLILLAGGRGTRAAGEPVPKQFRPTGSGPLFAVSLDEFAGSATWRPATVTVTAAEEWRALVEEACVKAGVPGALATPGETRTASTWSALEVLHRTFEPAAADLVAVHDTARPFATADLMTRLCEAAVENGGAIPGVAVPDTIVRADGPDAVYLQRDLLRAVQTPQVFRWDIFFAAHAHAAEQGLAYTDDGGLLAARGHDPAVVEGEPGNWKVTTDADWERARDLLAD